MAKLLYIEGPDHSGKTTLIEKIRKEQDRFYHNGVFNSPQEAYFAYKMQIMCYEEDNFENDIITTIMDRGPCAEQIYGSIMRNQNMSAPMLEDLLLHLNRVEAHMIICLPPMITCLEGWMSRRDQEYVKDTELYKDVWRGYNDLLQSAENIPLEITHYDYTVQPEFTPERD